MHFIHLHNVRFFAHHGLHDEELAAGNDFEVSLDIGFEPTGKVENLQQTINYVSVYNITKAHFAKPEKLLETLAENIIADIKLSDSRIKTINITIIKLTAPIANFTGKVGISIQKSF